MIRGWFKSEGLGWHRVKTELHDTEPHPITRQPYEWIDVMSFCGCAASMPADRVQLRGTKAPDEATCEKCLNA